MIYNELKTIVTPSRVMTNFKWIIFHTCIETETAQKSENMKKKIGNVRIASAN